MPSVLRLTPSQLAEMVVHCLRCYPEEGCGLLTGDATIGQVMSVHPTRNIAASAQVYTVDPSEHLKVDLAAESNGVEIIGVFHSHTHTDPWPSPTDVGQVADPSWHYVIISLRHDFPSTRSFRIAEGNISEESVVVADR